MLTKYGGITFEEKATTFLELALAVRPDGSLKVTQPTCTSSISPMNSWSARIVLIWCPARLYLSISLVPPFCAAARVVFVRV